MKLQVSVLLLVFIVIVFPACKVKKADTPQPPPYDPESLRFEYMTDERWVSSENLQICINSQNYEPILLTTGFEDYKPSWSKTGDKITFFRLIVGGSSTRVWKTVLCVVNSDGTGFRELSDGSVADFNMTWTRDGSELIIFNRYINEGFGLNRIYLIDPEGSPGDEVLVSDIAQEFEWAYSGLMDGRIFIDRFKSGDPNRSFLLTPIPGQIGVYEEISRPISRAWHKLSVSPSETKVCYMVDMGTSSSESYDDSVLYFADFDKEALRVSNAVKITNLDESYIDMYPRWSSDERFIIYDSTRTGYSQLYVYRLSDGITRRVSPNDRMNYNFGNFEKTPK
jgi:hypothetical protein